MDSVNQQKTTKTEVDVSQSSYIRLSESGHPSLSLN